ncbi:unnamed protein product, partial [Mycena citricolor]
MPTLPFVQYILGGLNLAVYGDQFIQGILFTQFATYISHGYHRTDPLGIRLWVAGLFVLTLFKTTYSLVLNYIQNTTRFLDLVGAIADYASLPTALRFLFVSLLVLYVQIFLCWRLWQLSRHPLIPIGLTIVFLVALVCGIEATEIIGDSKRHPWGAANTSLLLVGDLTLSASFIYTLLAQSRNVLDSTAGVLNRMAALTIQSALPASTCTVILLATSQASPSWFRGSPQLATAIVANELLPNLYAFSAMWTLNSRKATRDEMVRTESSDAEGRLMRQSG